MTAPDRSGIPVPALSPYLPVREAATVIAFLQRVLGAELRLELKQSDGRIRHAELCIGDGVVMVADSDTPFPSWVHLYVTDVDEVYRRALAEGGRSVRSPGQSPGDPDRRAGFADPFGNTWWIATRLPAGG